MKLHIHPLFFHSLSQSVAEEEGWTPEEALERTQKAQAVVNAQEWESADAMIHAFMGELLGRDLGPVKENSERVAPEEAHQIQQQMDAVTKKLDPQ